MNFKLNEKNGKVRYLTRIDGTVIGSDTTLDSATRLLTNGRPEKSDEFEGYPIALTNGYEYFFSGEWLMGGTEDVLGDDVQQDKTGNTQKMRKTNDADSE